MHFPILLGLVFAIVGITLALRQKKAFLSLGISTRRVKLTEIAAVFEKLQAGGKEGSFAVFLIMPLGTTGRNNAINLQLSIQNGCIGVDWVLVSPANIRDKDLFQNYAATRGYTVLNHEMNSVRYLRVETGGDLAELCERSIEELYTLPPDSTADMIVEGFDWP